MMDHPKARALLDDNGLLTSVVCRVEPSERPLAFKFPSSKPVSTIEVYIVPVEDYKYLILCRDELEAMQKSAKGL